MLGATSFLPASQCEVCRRWNPHRLCADCVSRFVLPQTRCRRCALPLPPAIQVCGECLHEPPPFEHTRCAVDYAFPWDRLLTAFKFEGQVELAAVLAERLAGALADAIRPDLVLPVPLAPRRLSERGYNQAWELARRLARRQSEPTRCCARSTVRTRPTCRAASVCATCAPLSSSSRARVQRCSGAASRSSTTSSPPAPPRAKRR
jgi:predicted amidophosphoribosyltransferase